MITGGSNVDELGVQCDGQRERFTGDVQSGAGCGLAESVPHVDFILRAMINDLWTENEQFEREKIDYKA